jgi:Domain of unknown function (DUF4295)
MAKKVVASLQDKNKDKFVKCIKMVKNEKGNYEYVEKLIKGEKTFSKNKQTEVVRLDEELLLKSSNTHVSGVRVPQLPQNW